MARPEVVVFLPVLVFMLVAVHGIARAIPGTLDRQDDNINDNVYDNDDMKHVVDEVAVLTEGTSTTRDGSGGDQLDDQKNFFPIGGAMGGGMGGFAGMGGYAGIGGVPRLGGAGGAGMGSGIGMGGGFVAGSGAGVGAGPWGGLGGVPIGGGSTGGSPRVPLPPLP